ncbi:MAG: AbrB/MazE/SpoVT family DNA-binding domain-containing protein [Acidobacteria bacterium]|nr:AbrB/MazE/SpoVT family DNA-binding domain-containing protein [Acidobacteriota bacterium]
MPVRQSLTEAGQRRPLSRIGQRRQVVIPKPVFESLGLQEGDFVEVSTDRRLIILKPKKLVDAEDVLTPAEAAKVRKGEAELRQGRSRPWRAVRDALAR